MVTSRKWRWPSQKQVLFAFGLLGFVHETVIYDGDSVRFALLVFFATMCGLPAFMKLDERTPPSVPPIPTPERPAR